MRLFLESQTLIIGADRRWIVRFSVFCCASGRPEDRIAAACKGVAVSNSVAGLRFQYKSVKMSFAYVSLTNRFPEIKDSRAASRSLPACVFTT